MLSRNIKRWLSIKIFWIFKNQFKQTCKFTKKLRVSDFFLCWTGPSSKKMKKNMTVKLKKKLKIEKKQSNQYHLIVLVFAPKWGIPFFSLLKILISFWTSYFTCTLIAFFIISTSWLCPHDTWNKRTDNMILYICMYRPIPQSVIVSTRSNGFQIYSLSTSYNFLHRLPSVKYFNTLKANNRDESSAGCVMRWDSWTGLYLLHQ